MLATPQTRVVPFGGRIGRRVIPLVPGLAGQQAIEEAAAGG